MLSPVEEIRQLFRRVFGDGIKILPLEEKTCYTCGGNYWWISKDDARLYCAVCHPPLSPELVAGWIGKKDEKIELKEILEEQVQVDYQKPVCKWCLSGKFLDCSDCKERRKIGKEEQGQGL